MRYGRFKNMLFPLAWALALGQVPALWAETGAPSGNTSAPQGIVTFDLAYGLFNSLGTYHDLTQAEEQRHMDVNREIIPVLEDIIREFGKEKAKYEALAKPGGLSREMGERIAKIERHLADFSKELRYRKTVLQYQLLLEKQKTLIQGE